MTGSQHLLPRNTTLGLCSRGSPPHTSRFSRVLDPKNGRTRSQPDTHRLLAYVADLELEVDRLRKQGGFIHHEIGAGLKSILGLCSGTSDGECRTQVAGIVQGMAGVLRALHEPPGYHPAHDQVVAIAVRPLIERVFQ